MTEVQDANKRQVVRCCYSEIEKSGTQAVEILRRYMMRPPWTLHDTLDSVMPYLVSTLGLDGGAGYVLEQSEG